MGRQHDRRARRDVGDVVDEHHALGLEALDDQLVVDDLVVAVHGRREAADHPGQRLDRHLHAGAEAPRLGEQHPLDAVRRRRSSHRDVHATRPRPSSVAWTGPCPLPRSSSPSRPVRRPIAPGSAPATPSLRLNGRVPRDVIEWRLWSDEADRRPGVARSGLDLEVDVVKRAGEPLGAEVSSAVFDRVRTCDNHCEFCFIYQLPKGLRRSLYLKDDDYRLSFLYGNFTTLTRFTEADLERVVTEGLSPLHVSIHSTDPALRAHDAAQPAGRDEPALAAGAARPRHRGARPARRVPGRQRRRRRSTTRSPGILDEYPELAVGRRRAARHLPVQPRGRRCARTPRPRRRRSSTPSRTGRTCTTRSLGRRLVHAADEYYLMAGRPFPAADAYEGFPMHEDGIGMARTFELEFTGAVDGHDRRAARVLRRRRRAGVAAAGTALPPNPAAYTGLRAAPSAPVAPAAAPLGPDRRSSPASSAPGSSAPLVDARSRRRPRRSRCANEFFGGNTGVTGLMTGADLTRVLAAEPPGHRYLLPDVCLSDDGRFLDGGTVADLPAPGRGRRHRRPRPAPGAGGRA